VDGSSLRLRAVAASRDGGRSVSAERSGSQAEAEQVGRRLAVDLASRGARELLHD
jgi:porphobilinogen deaminase